MSTAPRSWAVADTGVLLAAFNSADRRHDQAVAAFSSASRLLISPLVMAEVDYLVTTKVSEHAAIEVLARIRALTSLGQVRIPRLTPGLLAEAETLLRQYKGHAIGLTDAVNACLAWRLATPTVLAFDGHYAHTIAPRRTGESPLDVVPGPAAR